MKETQNDAILQLKGNQPRIEENCLQIIANQTPIDSFEKEEKAHGRIEYRKTEIYNTLNNGISLDSDWREYVQRIIAVTRRRSVYDTKEKKYKTSNEVSLYLATFSDTAQFFHKTIREHWGIENINHHVRDETMGEDKSRIRKKPQNFLKLRSMAMNFMRKNQVENMSNEAYRNALRISRLCKNYSSFF